MESGPEAVPLFHPREHFTWIGENTMPRLLNKVTRSVCCVVALFSANTYSSSRFGHIRTGSGVNGNLSEPGKIRPVFVSSLNGLEGANWYTARLDGYSLQLRKDEAVVDSPAGQIQFKPSRMDGSVQLSGIGQSSHYGYGLGRDFKSFAQVRYYNVYPGVDWVFYANNQKLEYDFVVSPGSDPSHIAMEISGTDSMRIDSRGDLLLAQG